jgi:hypothetical protein
MLRCWFRGARPGKGTGRLRMCIPAVRNGQSNTLLFSAVATLYPTSKSADGRQTTERCCKGYLWRNHLNYMVHM